MDRVNNSASYSKHFFIETLLFVTDIKPSVLKLISYKVLW